MIAWLEGALREKAPTRVLLDASGVGYELLVSLQTFERLPDCGKTVALPVNNDLMFGTRSKCDFTFVGVLCVQFLQYLCGITDHVQYCLFHLIGVHLQIGQARVIISDNGNIARFELNQLAHFLQDDVNVLVLAMPGLLCPKQAIDQIS